MTGLKVETPVSFAPSQNDRGPVALSIELVVNDALLDNAFQAALRIVGDVSVRKRGTTYGFATVEGSSHVLLRSQNFRDPEAWDLISIGDKVSFVLGKSRGGEYLGCDIGIEDKYWAP